MTHSKGITWIDDCRIPFVDEIVGGGKKASSIFGNDGGYDYDGFIKNPQGRFPANILVSDDMLNDGNVYSSGSGDGKLEMININDAHHYNYIDTNRKIKKMTGLQYNDKGSNSRYYNIDKWFDKIINYE